MNSLSKYNYKVQFQYIGTRYFGSQIQPQKKTIEHTLLSAISSIFKDVSKIVISGRTDRGVHAIDQYLNFYSNINISLDAALRALNNILPFDIRVKNVTIASFNFHSRYDARSREYYYHFSNCLIPLEFTPYCSVINYTPLEHLFCEIENLFLGEHDFSSFKKNGSNEKSSVRTVLNFKFKKKYFKSLYENENLGHYYVLEIKANGFLYRMVRNIVGASHEVLKGKKTIEDLRKLLESKNKASFPYSPADPKGLCLLKVNY